MAYNSFVVTRIQADWCSMIWLRYREEHASYWNPFSERKNIKKSRFKLVFGTLGWPASLPCLFLPAWRMSLIIIFQLVWCSTMNPLASLPNSYTMKLVLQCQARSTLIFQDKFPRWFAHQRRLSFRRLKWKASIPINPSNLLLMCKLLWVRICVWTICAMMTLHLMQSRWSFYLPFTRFS